MLTNEDLVSLSERSVYIRAHGEPPTTFDVCKKNGITVIDATCPVVSRLQQSVKKGYDQMRDIDGQVVIIGKKGHPEVIGLNGQICNRGIVVERIEDLDKVDFSRPIFMLSQTTKPIEFFHEISSIVEERFELDDKFLIIKDTICRSVSNREQNLAEFSRKYDLVIFVSGMDSSNGKALYEFCLKNNSNCYKIEDENELHDKWFEGVANVGICGATSTPRWLMERIADYIKNNF